METLPEEREGQSYLWVLSDLQGLTFISVAMKGNVKVTAKRSSDETALMYHEPWQVNYYCFTEVQIMV